MSERNEGRLAGRRVVVIGGASGFGLAVARLALADGATVVVTSRDPDRAASAASQLGAGASAGVVDAAHDASLAAFFGRTGAFDHLVSMAGGFMGGGFLGASFATIQQAVEEKLFHNLRIARHAAPLVAEGGSLVFTGGSGGRPHTASGAIVGNDAIRRLVEGLAVEVAPRARVNAVAPTWTLTPLWRHMNPDDVAGTATYFSETIPLRRTATIEEVADAYLFLMGNGFINGQTIAVDGGLTLVS